MIVIIQCAASKNPHASRFCTEDGTPIEFVANPALALNNSKLCYAHPDDWSEHPKLTWRQRLAEYNQHSSNPLKLLPAFSLYKPRAYVRLVERFGIAQVRILSAGWGLVRADYLLPYYDITFSPRALPYMRRRHSDSYDDFVQLDGKSRGPIVFLGGKDYFPLLEKLTRSLKMEKIAFFRAENEKTSPPRTQGDWLMRPYVTPALTNWHYGCAEFICEDPDWLQRTTNRVK